MENAKILMELVNDPKVSINSSLVVISKSFSSPGGTFRIALSAPITSSNVSPYNSEDSDSTVMPKEYDLPLKRCKKVVTGIKT